MRLLSDGWGLVVLKTAVCLNRVAGCSLFKQQSVNWSSQTTKMACTSLESIPPGLRSSFLESFDTILTDCDGVLWIRDKPIPGAPEVINKLKSMGKRVIFITNNSTKTRKQFLEKFKALGFTAEEEDIYSSSWLAAKYLKDKSFAGKAFVIGLPSITDELKAVGIESFGLGHDYIKEEDLDISGQVVVEQYAKTQPDVKAVIVGYDHYFSLPKIAKAATYLKNPNCIFLGTNPDENCGNDFNVVWPGAGPFIAAVETCALRPALIMGKPSPYIFDEILVKKLNINPNKTLMIGDKCSTDILFGNRRNVKTLLVLTGVSGLDEVQQHIDRGEMGYVPTYHANSVADLFNFMD